MQMENKHISLWCIHLQAINFEWTPLNEVNGQMQDGDVE